MKANIVAVQTYGYINGPEDLSSGAEGSRGRILAVPTLIEAGKIDKTNLIALFPQGYPKKTPRKVRPLFPLCDSVKKYFESLPALAGIQVVATPLGWSTFEDVQNGYKMVLELGYETAHIHFVSDKEQLKRVMLVWKHTHPEGWAADFHVSNYHRMSAWERLVREPVARFVYWIRLRLRK